MTLVLGSPADLARAFVRATAGQGAPEVPLLDPPEPEAASAVLTAPAAQPARRCDWCDAPLTGRQRRFCCDPHRSRWHGERRRELTAAIHEALADVQQATGRLQRLCDELAAGALRHGEVSTAPELCDRPIGGRGCG